MMDIYEMIDGKPTKTDTIKEDVWINLVNPTSEEIDTVARVRRSGNSYCVFITKELKELGLGPGDMVRMKLRRLE